MRNRLLPTRTAIAKMFLTPSRSFKSRSCAGRAATLPLAIIGRMGLDRAISGPRVWNWHGALPKAIVLARTSF